MIWIILLFLGIAALVIQNDVVASVNFYRKVVTGRNKIMAEKLKMKVVEDAVEYRLFPITVKESKAPALQDTLQEIFVHMNKLIGSYIWQNEPFNLRQNGNFKRIITSLIRCNVSVFF